MINYEKARRRITKYVLAYFEANRRPNLVYHNAGHTQYVVKSAEKIAAGLQLSEEDSFVVMAAASFHDIGYLQGREAHEKTSCGIARAYLDGENFDESLIGRVEALIRATQRIKPPAGLLEEIILDADTFHLGRKSFLKKSELLRKETELTGDKIIDRQTWFAETIQFLEAHEYYTTYGKTLLADQKTENCRHLKAIADQYQHNAAYTPAAILSKNTERAEKTIDTAFRIASQNNQRLSSMADNKAHILITVNSIILSALISLLLRKLPENAYLILPTFILSTISLLTMILAIIATRPNVTRGTFSKTDLAQKKTNLLFFGNYFKMQPEEYTSGMWVMLEDKIYLYNAIMLDIYYQGKVIGTKYRYLHMAYNIFMCGLVISVIAFFIAAILHHDVAARP